MKFAKPSFYNITNEEKHLLRYLEGKEFKISDLRWALDWKYGKLYSHIYPLIKLKLIKQEKKSYTARNGKEKTIWFYSLTADGYEAVKHYKLDEINKQVLDDIKGEKGER